MTPVIEPEGAQSAKSSHDPYSTPTGRVEDFTPVFGVRSALIAALLCIVTELVLAVFIQRMTPGVSLSLGDELTFAISPFVVGLGFLFLPKIGWRLLLFLAPIASLVVLLATGLLIVRYLGF